MAIKRDKVFLADEHLSPNIFTCLKKRQSLAAPHRQLMNLLSSGLSFATMDSLK